MVKTDFIVVVNLPPQGSQNPEDYVEYLHNSGCDDALIDTTEFGVIALNFSRKRASTQESLESGLLNSLSGIRGGSIKSFTWFREKI